MEDRGAGLVQDKVRSKGRGRKSEADRGRGLPLRMLGGRVKKRGTGRQKTFKEEPSNGRGEEGKGK